MILFPFFIVWVIKITHDTAAKGGWDGKISGSKDATRDKKRIDQRDQSSMWLRNTRFQSVKVLDHINTI